MGGLGSGNQILRRRKEPWEIEGAFFVYLPTPRILCFETFMG